MNGGRAGTDHEWLRRHECTHAGADREWLRRHECANAGTDHEWLRRHECSHAGRAGADRPQMRGGNDARYGSGGWDGSDA